MNALFPSRGLYALVDTAALGRRGLSPVEVARAVFAGRPAAVQLRAKDCGARETLSLLRALMPMARAAGVPFFANDRPDLAMLAGCDGVHVGQEDLHVSAARRVAPGLLVGVSTHNDEQITQALADRASYVAVGPVYPTSSKANPGPAVGEALLARALGRAGCPVIAIGGIDLERAARIGAMGAVGAVLSAIVPEGDAGLPEITQRVRALSLALGGAP